MLRGFYLVLLAVLSLLPGSVVAATYVYAPEPFSWIDPAGHTDAVWTRAPGPPGNECSGASAAVDDDITQELPLGFSFNYGGTPYTSVRIMSNGRVQFNNTFCGYGTQTVGPPRTYPYPYPNNNLLRTMRVYGADLNPAAGGTVRYAQIGTAPNRAFVITWSNVPEWNAAGSFFNLQMILYENGDFVYQYGNSNNPTAGKAQIGWQLTSSDFDLVSFTNIGNLASTAIRFSLPRPVAEYRLDEASWDGTVGEVLDSSANGIHGTAINGAIPVPARVCNGASLDGTNQYLNVPDHPLLDITEELTVMTWIRPDVIPSSGLKSIASKDENYEFHINSAGQIFWWWNNSSGTVRTLTTTGTPLSAGNWYHIAVVYSRTSASQKIYINGVERASSNLNESLLTNADPFQIGADQGFAGREFDGLIDEVRIYNIALDSTQVTAAMNETRTCPLAAVNNILLSTAGNATLGSNNLNFRDGDLVEYDPVNDLASLYFNEDLFANSENVDAVHVLANGHLLLSTTGSARLGSNNLSFSDGDIVDYDPATDTASLYFSENLFTGNEDIDALYIMDNGHILFSTQGSATLQSTPPLSFTSGDIVEYNPLANTATIFFSESRFASNGNIDAIHLLANGRLLLSTSGNATLGSNNLTFTDGDIIQYDLLSDIATYYLTESIFPSNENVDAISEPVPPVILHHLQIEHDGSALTCEPENVTVRACATADCSTLVTTDVVVTLSPPGWVGGDTQTINGGSAVFRLRDTTPGLTTLGISSSTPSASNPYECLNTSSASASCDITFHDTGFVYTIPAQTSCATSAAITVAAVRKDDVTQQCVPSFSNRTETVNFWTTYVNPGSGGNQVTLNNGSTDYLLDTASPGTAVSLNFDLNGEAAVTVSYPDAGQLSLNSEFSGSGADAGLLMTGSATWVTKPDHFYVYSDDLNSDCASADVSCSVFRQAGQAFNLKVRAACADNSVTPNFQHNGISLTHTLVSPAAGVPGTLGATSTNIVAADNGETVVNNQTVSEVGVFTFTAQLASGSNYLGETSIGTPASNTSVNIGRFVPAWFDVTRIHGCAAGAFTYSGQPFSVTATARNTAGNVTSNYDGALAFARATTVSDAGDPSNFNNNTLAVTDFSAGVGTRADVSYTFPGPDTPPATITLRAADADNVSSLGHVEETTEIHSGRVRIDNAFGSELEDLGVPTQVEHYTAGGFAPFASDVCTDLSLSLTKVDGTLNVGNGAGAGDTCIWDDDAESGANNCSAASILPGPASRQYVEAAALSNGDFNVWLRAPGQNFTGNVDVTAIVPAWLRYDWSGLGPADPVGRATFGIYRGDDRIIYWREQFE